MVASVGISVLQFCELFSTRNISIIGVSFLMGLMIPQWLIKTDTIVKTGSAELDQVIKVLFGTAAFIGGFIGFMLDNIVPGTEYERGSTRWVEVKGSQQKWDEATLYSFPVLTSILERMRCCSYFPLSHVGDHDT